MIGSRLGPCEVTSAIGAGGMGEVWRATEPRPKREVGIRVLPEAFATEPGRLARFEREAMLLASLNHPNVAQVYGFESATTSRTSGWPISGEGSDVRPLEFLSWPNRGNASF